MLVLRRRAASAGVVMCALLAAGALRAQGAAGTQAGRRSSVRKTVPALMVSDIHFDPFHDPAKARELARDPVSEWAGVLASPASPHQAAEFAALQSACHERGADTPYALLRSSVGAMQAQGTRPRFITVTGDLLAHRFVCRYEKAVGGPASGYEPFVEKTLKFVVGELHAAWPDVPIYFSLGNNDSACGDYRLDAGSRFLAGTARIFGEGLPARERKLEMREFPAGGYYSVKLLPLRNTRLIVLNTQFLSPNYRTCGGAGDAAPGTAELKWLHRQLAEAQGRKEKVWVIGHIPPGVNAYTTLREIRNVCGGEKADMFLHGRRLDDLLLEYSGEVRLVLLGHTHMDEMRLLQPKGGGRGVAMKLVPSISPVDGNDPAFTEAKVGAVTAVLKDFEVIAASNRTGVGTKWRKEYDFDRMYHERGYTPEAVRGLIAGFHADAKAKTAASQEYIRNYYVGDMSGELTPFWPQYVCSLDHLRAKGFAGCVCGK